jgi:Zn-finger nucleic acid-binding protein
MHVITDEGASPYRNGPAVCPQCGIAMDERIVPYPFVTGEIVDVHVDVCSSCAGIWLDGDDGNEHALVQTILREEGGEVEGAENDDVRPLCPRCGTFLDLDMEVKGAVMLRCPTCQGAFVTRPQAVRLAAAAEGSVDLAEALSRARPPPKTT